MKTEHEYAQVLRWIADGEQLQAQIAPDDWPERWVDIEHQNALQRLIGLCPPAFRIRPRTILINGIEVPEPLRVAPEANTRYWYIDIGHGECSEYETVWKNDAADRRMLKRGICHATQEAAETHARALLSFTEVKE